jgi:hypothetical protein
LVVADPVEAPSREWSPLVERFRAALMAEHADDWDMETVAEAAYICAAAVSSPASTDPAVVNESVASFSARENAKAQVPSTDPPSDPRQAWREHSSYRSRSFVPSPAVPSLPVPDPQGQARDTYPTLAGYATPGDIGGRPHQTAVGQEFAAALDEIDSLRATAERIARALGVHEAFITGDRRTELVDAILADAEFLLREYQREPSPVPDPPDDDADMSGAFENPIARAYRLSVEEAAADPPDTMSEHHHGYDDVRTVFARAIEMAWQEGYETPQQVASYVLGDATQDAGAVVVFAEGLPMGARLEKAAQLKDAGILTRRNRYVGDEPLWRVLTDKEPQP